MGALLAWFGGPTAWFWVMGVSGNDRLSPSLIFPHILTFYFVDPSTDLSVCFHHIDHICIT